jgi:hypothetical protein
MMMWRRGKRGGGGETEGRIQLVDIMSEGRERERERERAKKGMPEGYDGGCLPEGGKRKGRRNIGKK